MRRRLAAEQGYLADAAVRRSGCELWEATARVGSIALLLLPGALIVYFAFNSGGTFPVTTATGALVVIAVMLVAVAVAGRPLAGFALAGLLTGGLLAGFALWTLLSASWSHATGRTLVAFGYVLLYLLVFLLFAGARRSVDRVRWMLRGLLVGAGGVALIGLISRLLPPLWPTSPGLEDSRLSYPITYWNTFALLAGVGCILAVHHTCDERERASVRVAAAAVLPLLAAALLLTLSRGAIVATVVGVLAYMAIARPRGLPGGLLAAGPATALAVVETYRATLVQTGMPVTPLAISQAHRLATVLAVCAVAAAVLRLLTLLLDARLIRLVISDRRRRLAEWTALVGVLVLLAAAVTSFHGLSWAHRQYDKFVAGTHGAGSVESGPTQRERLFQVGNDGRLPLWRVALSAYRQDPLKGTGAGTYRLQWERDRSEGFDRVYAYSLYAEVLGELGLVGILLLAAVLLTILVTVGVRARGPGRSAWAAGFAVVLAWVLHAGVDWDWQTPAVTVTVFAIGGLASTAPGGTSERPGVRCGRVSRRISVPTAWASNTLARGAILVYRPALALICVGAAVFPAAMALAQTHLQAGVEALNAGSCARAETSARGAIARLDTGARPYEVLAMCAARQGDPRVAVGWARVAVAHDPHNWEPYYVLALADGMAGIDPRGAAQTAYEDDPQGQLPRLAVLAFPDEDPLHWRLVAENLPFSFD
jgi:O-antigen ligase